MSDLPRLLTVDDETYAACVDALIPYAGMIQSERHRQQVQRLRHRDVQTVMETLVVRGWRFVKEPT